MPFLATAGGRIEYERVDSAGARQPTIVMLHEGLGSVSTWRDFPERLAEATQCSVVVYSRPGHGRSGPLRGPRSVRYMHDEALVILPEVLDGLGIRRPVLFGHSDGASIALIFAGRSNREVAGIVALAPHVLVEDISVAGIAGTGKAYATTDLRQRLARHHDDADALFRAWLGIWLHPDFRAWNIEECLPRIRCPVLAIQGEEDQYGTMDQLHRLAAAVPDTELVKLPECRHSPHRDQPEAVLAAVTAWLARSVTGRSPPRPARTTGAPGR